MHDLASIRLRHVDLRHTILTTQQALHITRKHTPLPSSRLTLSLPTMLASALKASRLSQVRNARGYASAAGRIGDKKVPMSPLEQDRFINYQVRVVLLHFENA